jgi:hypothetical protein
MVKIFLIRFVKIMLTTAVLSVLGVVFIVVALFYLNPNARPQDLNYAEHAGPISQAVGSWFGVMFLIGFISVVAGLPKTFTVAFQDRESFIPKLKAAIASVRYRPKSESENDFVFKPPIIGGPLAEKIYVRLDGNVANVSAPRGLAKKLESKLVQ